MLISCTSCPVRDRRCETCVVSTFLGMPAQPTAPEWEHEDHRVLDALCGAGLVNARDAAEATLKFAEFTGLRAAV